MKNGQSSMDNSILATLASINATVLSIILGALLIFFFYSYQKINELQEGLNDSRIKISQMMETNTIIIGSMDYKSYLKDEVLDFRKISDELSNFNFFELPEGLRLELEKAGILKSKKDEIEFIGEKLLSLIQIVQTCSPYSERLKINNDKVSVLIEGERKEYSTKWKDNLIINNMFLSSFWRTRKDKLLTLLSQYNELSYEKSLSNGAQQSFKKLNYKLIIEDFFSKIEIIQNDIIPDIKDKSYKLEFYQNKFTLKKYLITSLVLSIVMAIFGIFLPLFIHLYWSPPFIKEIELGFLIFTILFYCSILLFFLRKALEFKSV